MTFGWLLWVGLWTGLCASASAPADGSTVRRYAILIGANDGGPDRVQLRYAHADADAVERVLTELGGVGLAERVVLRDPTTSQLSEALRRLGEELEDGSGRVEVVFYYSGHSDEDGLLLGGERFSYAALREAMEGLEADVKVAILDSCASGALVVRKGGTMVAPFLVDASSLVEGYAYITSTSADEAAQEAERVGGSYFTHYLTTGLRGAADASMDGRVTLSEAYRFAFDETLARTEGSQHGPQHPSYDFQLAGTGDLVLTDLRRTSATLVFGEAIRGRTWVRDAEGHLIAELSKPEGRVMELGLPAGNYTVSVRKDETYAEATLRLEEGTSLDVVGEDFVWSVAEGATARGDGAEPEPVHRAARVQLFPHLGAPEPVIDHFTLNIGGGRSTILRGVAVGLGVNLVDEEASGWLATLGGNAVGGDARGVLWSLGLNTVVGDARGVLGTLGANVVRGDLIGVETALGVNVSEGTVTGLSASLGANVVLGDLSGIALTLGGNGSRGDFRGVEVALGANVAPRSAVGLQVAGGANVARDLRGAQIGSVNVALDGAGAQVGLINVARRMRGVQLGLINVAEEMDGVPLGLVNVVRRGRHDPLLYVTESEPLNLDLKLGSRHFFTVWGVGGSLPRRQYVSGGLGLSIPVKRLWVDLDAQWLAYFEGWRLPGSEGPAHQVRGRAMVGFDVVGHLGPFAGVSLNYVPPFGDPIPLGPGWGEGGTGVSVWPGGFAGIQF